jgi:hypothetical protein
LRATATTTAAPRQQRQTNIIIIFFTTTTNNNNDNNNNNNNKPTTTTTTPTRTQACLLHYRPTWRPTGSKLESPLKLEPFLRPNAKSGKWSERSTTAAAATANATQQRHNHPTLVDGVDAALAECRGSLCAATAQLTQLLLRSVAIASSPRSPSVVPASR